MVIIVGGIFLISTNKEEQPTEDQTTDSSSIETTGEQNELIKKYEKLELAYNNTLNEIETVIEDDNMNLNILKENLTQILTTIKEEKQKINLGKDSSTPQDNTRQLEELLDMSKEVLAERLLEEKNRNEKLTIDNRKLHYNLKKSMDHFEKEKTKNVKLNAEVSQIKTRIKSLEQEGESASNELKVLKRQKDEVERRLIESNKTIKQQTEQIQELGEIIRKVNVDCYYFYEKGNPTDEAKIYLTSQGVSEKYVKYFVRQKPDIYVEFKITKDFFDYNIEKVDLKLYNSLNIEIYSVSKVVNSEYLKIIIPNKNYSPGKYSISLYAGDENLLLDDRYWFKIVN
ncbi:MAG: hypothetical protein HC831_06750 [Chloroflexia bacterium]|nr:hypothetical protein [Chloroflexia bacterium]